MQKRKGMKLIASMLVFMLTITHLNVIGEVLATSLESQTTQTNHANVEFDAYFTSGSKKEYTATKMIGAENYLYTDISVKNAGYLTNASVSVDGANFEISETLSNEQISKVEKNEVEFNRINNGSTLTVAIPIQMIYAEVIDVKQLSKDNTVKFTATYVDGNGKEVKIEKDITVSLTWTAQKQAEVEMQISKFIPYEINNETGVILEMVIKSYLKDNVLPVKQNKIEISVPEINGVSPEEINVRANTLKATTGDETGYEFDRSNYRMNSETGKFQITVDNRENENGEVSWKKEAYDEIVVTYIYKNNSQNSENTETEEEITNEIVDSDSSVDAEIFYTKGDEVALLIDVNNTITTYDATETEETTATKNVKGEATLKDQVGNLVEYKVETNTPSISKGQIYANYEAQEKLETQYQENITVDLGLVELTGKPVMDKVVLEQSADSFITAQDVKAEATNTYYKTVTVDQEEFNRILTEDGSINFFVGTTQIGKIDKETPVDAQGKFTVDLLAVNTNSLRIETSSPAYPGKINFTIVKAIKGEVGYTKEKMQTFNRLGVSVLGKALKGETVLVEQTSEKQITFTEPTTQAELVINNSNLTTLKTNENVKITAVLKTDTLNCRLYTNPTLQITLPNCIENINVKKVEALFDTEASKLTVKSQEVVQNADGTKTILVNLEGNQTAYTLGAVSKGVNVVITSDITVNKFTANKQEQIKMVYTNNNTVVETKEVALALNIVAPVGVITTSTMSNYKDTAETITSVSGEEQTATVPILSEARNANLYMEVINNYNKEIKNISILGRTAFKGNKHIIDGIDLGTTINMPLSSNITVGGVDASKVAIYYSENGEATKDLSVAANGWTNTPTSLENVKSYLIVLADHSMNKADRMNFNYTMQIPANMQHNESAYENYVVYFDNVETGITQDKQASTKLGVTTGKGAVLEATMSSNIKEEQEVLSGDIIKYTLTVKNSGTETAENVVATIDVPEYLQYIELDENTTMGYKIILSEGQFKLELGNIAPSETVNKEINMLVSTVSSEEENVTTEIKANIKSDKISGQIETNTVKNTIVKPHFIIASTVLKDRKILRESDEYTYNIKVVSSGVYETRKDTVLEIVLPQEIEYQSIEAANTTSNYDEKTRKLTIDLGDVDGSNTKSIDLNVKVGKLEENVYDKIVNIDAKVSAKNARTQTLNIEPVQIGKIGFKVVQSSNIPENAHIASYEDFKYIFTIENLSSIDLFNVKVTDILPKEVKLGNILATSESGKTKSSYENNILLNIGAKETVKLEVNVTAGMLEETKTVSNKATIEYEGIDTITTSSYTHIIDKFDESLLEGSGDIDPEYNSKRIMGQVWEDSNNNGIKDEDEKKVPNVEMLLFNNATGNLVRNSNGEVLRTTTDENGTYTFAGVNKGKYTVIYLYDTTNYSATTYRKENVNETLNSDAVDTKITLDGITRVAAITEEIAVTDSNIYNIDLGLVSNPKFDLKLDKTVSKITVQDAKGTNVYEFNDSKLAKKDLVGKQIAGTTIIVEYKIKVTNEGAISGFVKKIADYMPQEMKFNSELNKDWYTSENGVLYNSSLANTIINPGESKEVTLLLTKKMTENNLGLYHNEAEIYEAYNDLGIEDIDSTEGNKSSNEDDISSADVLITVKTGETILFVGLGISILTILIVGIYFIKRRILK